MVTHECLVRARKILATELPLITHHDAAVDHLSYCEINDGNRLLAIAAALFILQEDEGDGDVSRTRAMADAQRPGGD